MTLEVKELTVAYGDHVVLDRVGFHLEKGLIIGLVAPNGTGKTTLFNAMMRFIPIQSGQILIDGIEYTSASTDVLKLHELVTFFPDQADLHENFSGTEHIQMYADIWKKDRSQVDAIIKRLQMADYVERKVETYSLGMRQRLCFAMMIAADTPIMLMDEVMNGLDPENVELVSGILRELRREGKIIMVSSHLLDNLDEYADQVYFLKDGHIHFTYNRHEKAPEFYKVQLNRQQQETLADNWVLPADTVYLNGSLVCIPLSDYTPDEQVALFQVLRQLQPEEMAVGPLGTAEYYTYLYGTSETAAGRSEDVPAAN